MAGRLSRLAVVTGTQRSEFTYDGFSRRTKIVGKVSGTVTGTKQFVWVGGTIAEERDGNDVVQKKFYGLGEWRNGVGNLVYTFDHLGSLREMTQADGALNGTVRARYEYDPYGRRSANLITGGNALAADWGFTGHYYHAPSTLHLAWFRAYDGNLGRWISRDPIGEDDGPNLYAYVGGNPVNWLDPVGNNRVNISLPSGYSGAVDQWNGPNGVDFEIHVYNKKGVEEAVVRSDGVYHALHGKNVLKKPSDLPPEVRKAIRDQINQRNRARNPVRGPRGGVLGFIAGLFLGGACGLEAAADHGSFNDVYSAAANGEEDLDDLMYDASIDAAIESGQAGALPTIYGGWYWLDWWNEFWGD